jgi:DNA-binding response OmpR family regulator
LMLTGRGKETDKETALDSGADDYLTKPFGVRELNARLRALLRRPANVLGSRLEVGLLVLDSSERSVRFNGNSVNLQPKEFAILEFFMRHPDTVHSTEILVNSIWSSDSSGSIQSLYTYMKSLRKKIAGPDGECCIKTVHGVGYKLVSK